MTGAFKSAILYLKVNKNKETKNISNFYLIKSLLAIFPLLEGKIRIYRKKIKKRMKTEPKLVKNPIICFGVIFIFGITVFSSSLGIKSLSAGDFYFLNGPLAEKEISSQNFFAQPAKNFLQDSPEKVIVQENSLVAVSAPNLVKTSTLGGFLADSAVNYDESDAGKEILEYIVESGDTVSSLAEKFNISKNTILWANDLTKTAKLKPGQELIILPVSGVLHNVKSGDTLSQIVKTYKGNVEEIISFNELSGEGDIYIGDILVIPNGVMTPVAKPAVKFVDQIPVGASYFICPISTCRKTQGLHWYNAIDFGASCGDPIYAAAAGVVQRVKFGYNGGAGNTVNILHPNGVATSYGHVSVSLVTPGQQVSQGEIIALIGGKPGMLGAGKSTGCHVHFAVHGAKNPFTR